MRITESQLRCRIRSILLERRPPPPDEPDVKSSAALGQYFLPRLREKEGYVDPYTRDPLEKNTKFEDEVEEAITTHYAGGGSQKLAVVWPRLWKLAQSGLYTKWLIPKAKYAYRWMGGVPPDVAVKILGVDLKTLRAKPLSPHVAETAPVFTAKEGIASWTVDPGAPGMSNFANGRMYDNSVNILLEARVTPDGSGGQFLIHTANFTRDFMRVFDSEQEIIGYGPIEITRAAWFYTPKEGLKIGKKGFSAEDLPHSALTRALGI